jgi:hypothetical protein
VQCEVVGVQRGTVLEFDYIIAIIITLCFQKYISQQLFCVRGSEWITPSVPSVHNPIISFHLTWSLTQCHVLRDMSQGTIPVGLICFQRISVWTRARRHVQGISTTFVHGREVPAVIFGVKADCPL